MSEEILINVTATETRVALIENSLLQEIFIERHNHRGHVGDIFYGKVIRVMPGMEAAFVDIGLEKAAFIHASDIAAIDVDGFETRDEGPKSIQQLLREGQFIVVQVAKDAISTKGARLTTHLSLPSRNLVYLPRSKHLGISQRIEGDGERQRLLTQLGHCLEQESWGGHGGFIVRTAAEGGRAEEFCEDIRYLRRLWSKVKQRIERTNKIGTVYGEVPLYMRITRDLITTHVERIRVDNEQSLGEIQQFLEDFIPESVSKLEAYTGDRPLIIDQTEAMTTIDVNTGGYLGVKNHAETILKTNLEAATSISRQLRIRNLGGIIILDFIDMLDEEHQRQVHRTLEKALGKDPARTSITGISELGLVEMTRKRTRESLGQILNSPCPICEGRGTQKSAETVCYEIFREILRVARAVDSDVLRVMASQVIVDRLLDEESDTLADLRELVAKTVNLEVEPMYTQEQFDVVLSG
jgi:ribonuclease G